MKPVIVHVSADFPDAWQPRKTRAIASLVEGTADRFNHRVYSLNRKSGGLNAMLAAGEVTPIADDGRLASWTYAQPGKGILLASAMHRVADAVVADIKSRGLKPQLVQGHKLSIEGIAAQRIAEQLGIPYALTLQGNTDQKIIAMRPDLRGRYREIWRNAAAIVAFAPWIATWCTQKLGPRAQAPLALPCVPSVDRVIPPRATGPRILTAFHLDHWRNKNIETLAKACMIVRARFPDVTLEIAGQGGPEAEREVDNILRATGAAAFSRRLGHVGTADIQDWMNQGAVFAMPSKRESFGMVFVEALLAGCPIVYPRGAAVDGYFQDALFAIGIDARSYQKLASAIIDILKENEKRKIALQVWQELAPLTLFSRHEILSRYSSLIDIILEKN